MSLLGDALESMSTSAGRWASLQADLHWWADRAALTRARTAAAAARGTPVDIQPPGFPRVPVAAVAVDEQRGSLLATPRTLRVEWHASAAAAAGAGAGGAVVAVVRGEEWRERRAGSVRGSQVTDPGTGLTTRWVRELVFVRPWRLLSCLHLKACDALDWHGRPATWLRAEPRENEFWSVPSLHSLTDGDAYDLVVDSATGVLLDLTTWYADQEVERCWLGDPRFDAPVDPASFDLETIGTAAEAESPIRRARPLASLADEVDFTVLSPRGEHYTGVVDTDEGGSVVVAHPSGGGPGGWHRWFTQSGGARMADPAEWEPIQLPDGTHARRWSPSGDPDQVHLRFERAGTQVWVQGRGRRDVHRLAASLEPVSR
ncbi:hypothetical protein MXD63_03060 [Frankia sp. Cpl3]|nr:hypothetical protein [Parafrankia colletiae]MCK9899059.1 hypothetical protein [Frankia sp. Cpl3]